MKISIKRPFSTIAGNRQFWGNTKKQGIQENGEFREFREFQEFTKMAKNQEMGKIGHFWQIWENGEFWAICDNDT